MGSIPDLTPEYFRQEMDSWRRVVTSTAFTLEQKDRAYSAMALMYLNLPDTAEGDKAGEFFLMMSDEWMRRREYHVRQLITEGKPVPDPI